MRVLVAGAGGAIGGRLLPALILRGHDAVGLVRSGRGAARVAALGARPLVVDALDAAAVDAAVRALRPDAVAHELTALPHDADLRDFDAAFAATNRLRTHGLDGLLAAARAVGVRRFVAQSFCGWPFARVGGPVKADDAPLDDDPPAAMRATLDALRHVESAMRAAADVGGVALRYGALYGPGTAIAADGALVAQLRRRRLPVVGAGGGVWSFLHVADAAGATVAALEGDARGVFNAVDDDPSPVAEWLPALARAVGAPAPRRLPALLGRLLLPAHLRSMMTEVRGGSNDGMRRAFGWRPAFASWRDGFVRGL